jgi:hypothetical protein
MDKKGHQVSNFTCSSLRSGQRVVDRGVAEQMLPRTGMGDADCIEMTG